MRVHIVAHPIILQLQDIDRYVYLTARYLREDTRSILLPSRQEFFLAGVKYRRVQYEGICTSLAIRMSPSTLGSTGGVLNYEYTREGITLQI